MNLRRLAMMAVLVAGACASSDRANAQYGGCGFGGGYGGYWDIGRLYAVMANNVPYYSAFPPVYYSYPVPRTYGYSPFAYPPGVMTPEVETAMPLSIANPYFKGSSEVESAEAAPAAGGSESADRTTSTGRAIEPLVVVNPYVVGSASVAGR